MGRGTSASKKPLRVEEVARALGISWSADTSLTLCTIDTLPRAGEDYQAQGQSFVRWLDAEIWTPRGRVFDVVARQAVAETLAREIKKIDYANFKDSLPEEENDRRDAYTKMWRVMQRLQEARA